MKALVNVRIAIAAVVFGLRGSAPASAQDRQPLEVSVAWAPIFSSADSHILPAWAAEISGGGTRSVSAVVDISGWYFFRGSSSIHHFAAGPRYTFRTPGGNRGFLQVVAGSSLFHVAGGTAMRGLVLVPGGGVDVALPARRLAVRVQGDYFGVYYPGDYEYRWDHAWRASTGLVFQLK